jgi:hypothetical protein
VLVPGYGEVARLAGKEDAYHPLALDLLLAGGHTLLEQRPQWADSLFDAVATAPRPPAIVIGAPQGHGASERLLRGLIERAYRPVAEWRELSDSPTPRFVYAAGMETTTPSTVAFPLVGAAIASADTNAAR